MTILLSLLFVFGYCSVKTKLAVMLSKLKRLVRFFVYGARYCVVVDIVGKLTELLGRNSTGLRSKASRRLTEGFEKK